MFFIICFFFFSLDFDFLIGLVGVGVGVSVVVGGGVVWLGIVGDLVFLVWVLEGGIDSICDFVEEFI